MEHLLGGLKAHLHLSSGGFPDKMSEEVLASGLQLGARLLLLGSVDVLRS